MEQAFTHSRAVRYGKCLIVAAVLSAAVLGAAWEARSQQPIQLQRTSTGAASAKDPAASAISSLVEQGRSMESAGRWGEALAHYEQALREHPDDQVLLQHFDVARMHYSLEKRYSDRSFRTSVGSLAPQQASALYSEMLTKINTYYYEQPAWADLSRRGVRAVDVALADNGFCQTNQVTLAEADRHRLREELRQFAARYAVRTRQDAEQMAANVSRFLAYRAGVNRTAVILEFAAAAAGGLDNYSAYLTADQLRDVYSQIEGNFVGLGVELKADQGSLLIVNVIPGSPAVEGGIRPGDRIVAVDSQATSALSTDEAAALLTGEAGTWVRVTIVSPGQEARTIPIRRDHVEVPGIDGAKIIDPQFGVAYLKIPTFQETTARDLDAALWDLHRQGMRSLVIDLRGNPGGLLNSSVEVADKFVADGPIVSTRGRSNDEDFDFRAHRPGTWRVPLVVLIDGDSASASEIFAAAIKDAGRGTIVGSRSFGKGSVQGIFQLQQGGTGIRLTTAKFYSPSGRPISNIGVQPDIDVRRATAAAPREMEAGQAPRQVVSYREGAGSAAAGMAGPPAADPSLTAAVREVPPSGDPALDIAVQSARSQPVVNL